jgi:small-conductance mechanosensitive channel
VLVPDILQPTNYIFLFLFFVCFILYFLIFVCFIALPTSFLLTFTLDGYIGRHSKADDESYFINIYNVFLL